MSERGRFAKGEDPLLRLCTRQTGTSRRAAKRAPLAALASSARRACLAYGLSLSSAPRLRSGFFLSGARAAEVFCARCAGVGWGRVGRLRGRAGAKARLAAAGAAQQRSARRSGGAAQSGGAQSPQRCPAAGGTCLRLDHGLDLIRVDEAGQVAVGHHVARQLVAALLLAGGLGGACRQRGRVGGWVVGGWGVGGLEPRAAPACMWAPCGLCP